MKSINRRYRHYFSDKSFTVSVIVALIFLIVSLIINFYAGTYATESAGNAVKDIILSNIPVIDVDPIFIYGPFVLWLFVTFLFLYEPKKMPFVVKSIALFVIIRSVFITLTHIGPFPDQITLDISPNGWINHFIFGGDLFFSAHTGLPFLMALIFWNNKPLRIFFIIMSVFFGIIVLLGHLHYSIDVLSAFFITYTIYHMAVYFFKKDKSYFEETVVL